jgi:hypothetical protein
MARTPGTQSSSELTPAPAARGQSGIGIGRNIQRTAAGKFDRAKRAGDAAQFAAYAQALVELDRAIDALDGVNRTDGGAGRLRSGGTSAVPILFHYASPAAAA